MEYAILVAFALIGGGLKFIDDAFDNESFNKNIAIFGMIVRFIQVVLGK